MMARAPFQVLVYPFRTNETGKREYCLFKRADNGLWQGIAGGGEDAESPIEAAIRETWEEAGLPPSSRFIRLDSVESIPAHIFKERSNWGNDVYVIPQYTFGVQASPQINLSQEHLEYRWYMYEEAIMAMRYDGDRTALWELEQRLSASIDLYI